MVEDIYTIINTEVFVDPNNPWSAVSMPKRETGGCMCRCGGA